MVHQPSGGFQGVASDIERHAENIVKLKRRLNELYAKHCGRSYDEVERTLDRDHFMSAEEDNPLVLCMVATRQPCLIPRMGCCVHSTLPVGVGYTTLEFKVTLIRAITAETGPVAAEGRILNAGRRVVRCR